MEKIEVKGSPIEGFGVFATVPIGTGEFIFESEPGELVTYEQLHHMPWVNQHHVDDSLYAYPPEVFGVVELSTAPSCYLNHSCQPNAAWIGRKGYAIRDIAAGEEITTDYRIYSVSGWKMGCKCGHCDGNVVVSWFSLPIEVRKSLAPFKPPRIEDAELS